MHLTLIVQVSSLERSRLTRLLPRGCSILTHGVGVFFSGEALVDSASDVCLAQAGCGRAQVNRRSLIVSLVGAAVLGAVFNLNHPARVVEWHFIQLSVANLIVIALMLVVFALAITLPFPGARARAVARRTGGDPE